MDVSATSTMPFACATTPRGFSATLASPNGQFQGGTVQATVRTADAEGWVTPASVTGAVRLIRSR